MSERDKRLIAERRAKFWQAQAFLAALGRVKLDGLMLSMALVYWAPPEDKALAKLIETTKAAVAEHLEGRGIKAPSRWIGLEIGDG